MIEISEKFGKYLPSGRYKLGALLGIVVAQVNDTQSAQGDWDAGEQLSNPISTTLSAGINDTVTTIPVSATDEFTSANSDDPAYLIITDGTNVEIVKYADNDGTNFKTVTRAQYGTSARSWNNGDDVYQLIFSHGYSTSFDLQPQPQNWWTHLSVAGGPPLQRVGHGWVFRPTDGCFYMFGGYASDSNYKNDLWKYDPDAHTWTQVIADAAPGNPAARAYMACVYNSDDDEIWIFGGRNAASQYKDVHKYSLSSGTWSTSGGWDAGSERYKMQSCWDPENNRMIVAGGIREFGGQEDFKNNCWIFNGSNWSTKNSIGHSLALGSGCWMESEKLFFTVGHTSGGNYKAQVYNPISDSWINGGVANPPSGSFRYPACCYDSIGQKALVFGGEKSVEGRRQLWAYSFPANAWTQLASYKFDNEADLYSRHGFAWDPTNCRAVAWGGWNDSTPTWHTYDEPIFFRRYHASAQFRAQTMDMGSTPENDGIWNVEDVFDFIQGSNSIGYTAEYSDNGSSWTPMGVIEDGDAITDRHRYYRVSATLQCDGDEPPRVQKVDAVFDEVIEFSMADHTLGESFPLLKSMSNITSSIDPVKCTARIGSVSFELIDSEKIVSNMLTACYLPEKTVYLKMGPVADDISAEEFITVFTGVIDGWEYDGRVVKIKARDFLGKLEKDIPEETSGGSITSLVYSTAGIASNPVDILLDILRNRLDVPDRYIDFAAFDEVKNDSSITGWNFIRTISDPTNAYDLCLEICRHIGATLIPREDGRISLKMLNTSENPVDTWNEMWHNFHRAHFTANTNLLRNFVSTWWHWDGAGDDWSDFEGAEVATDAGSVSNWGTHVIRTKSKWLGDNASPYNGDQLAASISLRILNMAKEGLPSISLEADISTFPAQVGDVVRIQSSVVSNQDVYREWQRKYNPGRDLEFNRETGRSSVPYLAPECSECVDMLWWVTRKRIDINRGKVKWELMRCRTMPLEKVFTSQDDFYIGSGENIDLETAPGTVQLAEESPGQYYDEGAYELIIDLGQQPERDGSWDIDDDSPWMAPMGILYEAWASETGKFTGEERAFGQILHTDDITIKTRYYKIRATLGPNAAKTASPEINEIKITFPT